MSEVEIVGKTGANGAASPPKKGDSRHSALTPLEVPFVDLGAQRDTIATEISQAIDKVVAKTDFILGEDVTLFEEEFAAYCGAKYGIGVDSGISALELSLRAYQIGPGDEVITVANTFIATVLAISNTGATPVLVDADPETYNIDPRQIEAAISEKTKAILPVHLYGLPADMEPILEIARRHDLVVIEDASQAHGARYKGKRTGSFGHASAFSLYPSKNLGGYGDGGIIVTDNEQVAETIKSLRNYGQSEKYHHVLRGANHRLDTLQAAILRVKLRHLDAWSQERRRHADQYRELLQDASCTLPAQMEYAEAVHHVYPIQVADRQQLMEFLDGKGISSGIHYPVPIHQQPAYLGLGYKTGDFPVSEYLAGRLLSLPMYAELQPEAVQYVADSIKEFQD